MYVLEVVYVCVGWWGVIAKDKNKGIFEGAYE